MSEAPKTIKQWGKLEIRMTKVTTATILAGPKSVGSFGDEDSWRIGLTCQVVDGGSNGPFLLCNMPGRREQVIPWRGLTTESGVSAVLFALCIYYGDEGMLGLLEDTHNVIAEGGELRIAPFYEFSPEVATILFSRISEIVKIALIPLADDSSLTQEIVEYLALSGIKITSFNRRDSN